MELDLTIESVIYNNVCVEITIEGDTYNVRALGFDEESEQDECLEELSTTDETEAYAYFDELKDHYSTTLRGGH